MSIVCCEFSDNDVDLSKLIEDIFKQYLICTIASYEKKSYKIYVINGCLFII